MAPVLLGIILAANFLCQHCNFPRLKVFSLFTKRRTRPPSTSNLEVLTEQEAEFVGYRVCTTDCAGSSLDKPVEIQ